MTVILFAFECLPFTILWMTYLAKLFCWRW